MSYAIEKFRASLHRRLCFDVSSRADVDLDEMESRKKYLNTVQIELMMRRDMSDDNFRSFGRVFILFFHLWITTETRSTI